MDILIKSSISIFKIKSHLLRLGLSSPFPHSPQIYHTNLALTCLLIAWSIGRTLQRKRNLLSSEGLNVHSIPIENFKKEKASGGSAIFNMSPWLFLLSFSIEVCRVHTGHWRGIQEFTDGSFWSHEGSTAWEKDQTRGRRGGSKEMYETIGSI